MTHRTTLLFATILGTLFLINTSVMASPLDSVLPSSGYAVLNPISRGAPRLLADTPTALVPYLESMHLAIAMRLPDLLQPGLDASGSFPVAMRNLPLLATDPCRIVFPPEPAYFGAHEAPEPVDPPLEGRDKEIQISPSLITFFCNPYALEKAQNKEKGAKLNLETLKEIHLGVMGQITNDLRIALFSTVSMWNIRGESGFGHRGDTDEERMTHRFSLLFSVSPLPRLYIGAAGGAQVVDSPRAYSFEVLFEARARF
ncbi:MAG: hypothetical protein ACYS47_08825 [Planctomycetota bacterium]|jgi:hypothetical protein